jgi:hypothetical protein
VTSQPAPKLIEQPASAAIADVLERSLSKSGLSEAERDPLRTALVRVAARFAEVVSARVNAAPSTHAELFGSLIGLPPRQPEAASAFLMFKPTAAPAATQTVVPMQTSVASSAAVEGGTPPVFETQADLSLVRAEIVRALWVAKESDAVADASALRLLDGADPQAIVASAVPAEKALHIAGDKAFALAGLSRIVVHVELEPSLIRTRDQPVEWGLSTDKGFKPLEVVSDTTHGMTTTGEVTLTAPPEWPLATLGTLKSRWLTLRARDLPPEPGVPFTNPDPLPRIRRIALDSLAETPQVPVTVAFHDGRPLDTSKDFFPFGTEPEFGSVFQLVSPAFREHGARVELQISMTNPADSKTSPIPPVSRDGDPRLIWEISTTEGFRSVQARGTTRALTQDGFIEFTIPENVAPIRLGALNEPCVRARLASGRYEVKTASAPSLQSVSMKVSTRHERRPPDRLMSQGALEFRSIDPGSPVPFAPFVERDEPSRAVLYVALAGTDIAALTPTPLKLHLYVRCAPARPPIVFRASPTRDVSATPMWQYRRSPEGWRDLSVRDGSAGLTRSGIVVLDIPDATARWVESVHDPAANSLWLRALWPEDQPIELPLNGIAINVVEARNVQSVRNEIAGSSTGRASQNFRVLRQPVLGDVSLQVREENDAWVRWREADDVTDSGPDARDFQLDRLAGTLRFGDGRNGRIPPQGAGNIRLSYRTGGGRAGNVPARTITQLRTTVRGVESVINPEPASGGVDSDTALGRRAAASAWLRHRDRAICIDDFADLALRASPEVARAYCLPPREGTVVGADAGTVQLLVVPNGLDPRPQPSPALLRILSEFLDARRSPLTPLILVGPNYAQVSLIATVTVRPGFSRHLVTQECARLASAFFHPVSGNSDGRGWQPMQRPHRSDLYALLGGVDGVDFVRALELRLQQPDGETFIVSAGTIEVSADE